MTSKKDQKNSMNAVINNLSPEQLDALDATIEKWKSNFIDRKWYNNTSDETMVNAAKEMYKFCGFAEPRVIVCGSPLEVQIVANSLKGENYNHKIVDVMKDEKSNFGQVYLKEKIKTLFTESLYEQIREKFKASLEDNLIVMTTEMIEDILYNDIMHSGQINLHQDENAIAENILNDAEVADVVRNLNNLVKDHILYMAKKEKSLEKISEKLNKKLDAEIKVLTKLRENSINQMSKEEILNVVGNNITVLYSNIIKLIINDQISFLKEQDLSELAKNVKNPGQILVIYNEIISKIRKQVNDTYIGIFMPETSNYNEIDEHMSIGFYFNFTDICWQPFFDFVINELGLLSDSDKKMFNQMVDFATKCSYSVQYKDVCIVSKYPSEISRDDAGRLHNLNDYAMKYEDGYGQGYFHGRYIEPQVFNALKNGEYSFEEWTKEPNEEIKSMVLVFYNEKFGGEFTYRFLSSYLREVDTYIDKKDKKYLEGTVKSMNIGTYTLFKGNVSNVDIAYVRCYCPSTDRMFFLGVNPEHTNAKDAIASLCQVPRKLRNEVVSVARQGEIFSFNLTEKGNSMVKALKTEELRDVVSLSGDEYFGKMKFEY